MLNYDSKKKSVLITMIMIDYSQKVQISLMLLLIIDSKKICMCVYDILCVQMKSRLVCTDVDVDDDEY